MAVFFVLISPGTVKILSATRYNPQQPQVCGELVLKTLFILTKNCLLLLFCQRAVSSTDESNSSEDQPSIR
jgi:hypothetical protein